MTTAVTTCRLSAADAAFLYLERKEIPLHIASVCIFDGPIPFKEFVSNISAKLHLVPKYRQIPVMSTWNLEFPAWEDHPDFNIRRHIHHVTLPAPGRNTELHALADRILSHLLDRNKPLWDMYVVDGLNGERGAIIWRVHHALADGVSGASLIRLMLDSTPVVSRHKASRPRRARPARKSKTSLGNEVSRVINSTMSGFLSLEAGMLEIAQRLMGSEKNRVREGLAELLPEFAASIERLPFNKPCRGTRKFCWTEFKMDDVQAIREAAGGTINDVMLTVLTGALARYVKLHGESVNKRLVRIICPVNLRKQGENNQQGNQISFLPLALPLDARGPVGMLQAVTNRTATLKQSGAIALAGLAANWFETVPPILQALFWRNIPDLVMPVSFMNMIFTNVVGSPTPLYAMGRRMLAAYPQVPTGYDLGIGCAVHSYDGKLFFGINADSHAAPDVAKFREFLDESFQQLFRSVAVKKNRSNQKTKQTTKRRTSRRVNTSRPSPVEVERNTASLIVAPIPIEKDSKEAA